MLIVLIALVVLAAAGVAALALTLSGTKLVADATALARVDVGGLGGKLVSVTATGPRGGAIPLDVRDGRITPRRAVPAGTRIAVEVTVRRPGWIGWAIGRTTRQRLEIRTPSAHVTTRWTTVRPHGQLRVAFDAPVRRVAYGPPGHLRHVALRTPRRTLSLGGQAPAGTIDVAAAPRAWETLPPASQVSWFPAGRTPTAVSSPAPGASIAPTTPIRIVFSQPVDRLLRGARPTFSTTVPGRWRELDSHTLQFTPTGIGFGLGAKVHLTLPGNVRLATSTDATQSASQLDWSVPPGSTLRLHELLAQLGYLPLSWAPSGARVGSSTSAQLRAAVAPPKGSFAWRWPGMPSQLTSQWNADQPSAITRGALMAFQSDHGLSVDALAGPNVWTALFGALRDHKSNANGYSYVLVHRDSSTQTMQLWHDGKSVITSPANTGVSAAPTQLGTFPVYLRYPETTMSGTNPDGSHYNDPGIKYVSYFNGGDALHAFDRASYGTPQSVGCVELPLAAAARIYPYTPIGTLVTIAP